MRHLWLVASCVVVTSILTPPGPRVQAQSATRQAAADRLGLSLDRLDRLRSERGLSDAALAAIPPELLPGMLLRAQYPDYVRRRGEARVAQERDERGQIPPNALQRALQQLDALRARIVRPAVAGMPNGRGVDSAELMGRTAGLNPDQSGWQWLGPANIGGRTRAIVIHPTRPNTMWVASVGGGVWRTDDGGTQFVAVDDRMSNLAVTTLAIDPANASRVYAGTGEGYYNVDGLRGAGIFRTVDGVNWTQIAATAIPAFYYVNRLAVSRDGVSVLAATRDGMYRSADAARATWTRVLPDELGDVDAHPTDRTRAVAGGLRNGQAYFSTDGGATWRAATHTRPWNGRVELTYAAANPSIVYASVAIGSGEIWRSTDGGQTYEPRRTVTADNDPAEYLGRQGWYDNVIWAGDPTNSNLLVVGGIDLWKSTNGGDTLVDISSWWDPRSAHADHHVIAAHPNYDGNANRVVYFGNDGGIYRADDVLTVGGNPAPPRVNGWRRLNNNYGVTQFYGGSGHAGSQTIVGGTQDNGTLVYSPAGGTTWTTMFGGDGGWSAAHPTDANVMYGEYVHLNIHRSLNGGKSAEFISGQFYDAAAREWRWKPVPFSIPDAQATTALFIAPFVLDAQSPDRILGGGLELWRTEDARTANTPTSGPTWRSIKRSVGSPITAIAIMPGNSNRIWVGHQNGELYVTDDGTRPAPSWRKVDDSGPVAAWLPDRYITRVTPDPANPATVFVTFGGYVKGNVWRTTDHGATWRNVGATLPEAPVRTVVVHPSNSKFVYIGTEVGVFASEDGGLTWSPTNEGPTNCSVDELFWIGTRLVAATHGRGMFAISIPGGGTP
jgi:photosystem II stability/assembly factor-like uncharacterized protein